MRRRYLYSAFLVRRARRNHLRPTVERFAMWRKQFSSKFRRNQFGFPWIKLYRNKVWLYKHLWGRKPWINPLG